MTLWLLLLLPACGGEQLEIAGEYPAEDEATVAQQLIDISIATLKDRHSEEATQRFNQPRHAEDDQQQRLRLLLAEDG